MKRSLPFVVIIFAVSLYAADFWKTKDPDQWSQDEVNKMLTKSPWSKQITPTNPIAPSSGGMGGGGDMGGGGGDTGGGGGGSRGGGGGRGGGMSGGGSGASNSPIAVRWEGAAPVRAANARKQFAHSAEIDQWSQEFYVVSLTGFPPRSAGRGGRSGEARTGALGEPTQSNPRSGAPPASTNPNADLPNLRGATIKHDKKEALPVDKVMVIRTPQGPGLYLLFSRTNPITAVTKEVTVEFTIDRITTKAKFKVKDMEYRGKLEL